MEYRLDEQVGYILRLASQRHALIFNKHSDLGLTPTQFAAMVRIAEMGECSQNLLGRRTAMDVATIKGVVTRLKAKGFVRLSADPEDRRRTVVSLSAKGAEVIDGLHAFGAQVTEETLAPLNRRERKVFLEMLQRLT
jgi:DNA-binding MarR family transcriptional regulator